MPTQTTNFGFNKPLVNDPVDEDLWGGQLNTNWDSVDTIIDQLMPIGSMLAYAGTTAPNAKWLLCDGSAVSRTIYATLFTLVSTAYGVGDGSTTFNLPDYRGRAGVGLDNLGGSSANRITDTNADSLNATGVGSETDSSVSDVTGSHALTAGEMAHIHQWYDVDATPENQFLDLSGTGTGQGSSYNSSGNKTALPAADTLTVDQFTNTPQNVSASGHTHAITMTTGGNVQPSIAEGKIIRVL